MNFDFDFGPQGSFQQLLPVNCHVMLPLNFLGTIHADSEIQKTIIEDQRAVDTME